MKHTIKIIKYREETQKVEQSAEPCASKKTKREQSRAIVDTVTSWINERRERKSEELATSVEKLLGRTALSTNRF
jgi:hypothetical protein